MVLYQFKVPGHVYRKLLIQSWSVKSLGRKKGSRLPLCFRVVDDVPKKKGMDLWKQMSSKRSFTCICGIFLPVNPSTITVYARSAFYPGLRFTLGLQSGPVFILHTVCMLPLVRSPQSSFCTDRLPYRVRAWVTQNIICSFNLFAHNTKLSFRVVKGRR